MKMFPLGPTVGKQMYSIDYHDVMLWRWRWLVDKGGGVGARMYKQKYQCFKNPINVSMVFKTIKIGYNNEREACIYQKGERYFF